MSVIRLSQGFWQALFGNALHNLHSVNDQHDADVVSMQTAKALTAPYECQAHVL